MLHPERRRCPGHSCVDGFPTVFASERTALPDRCRRYDVPRDEQPLAACTQSCLHLCACTPKHGGHAAGRRHTSSEIAVLFKILFVRLGLRHFDLERCNAPRAIALVARCIKMQPRGLLAGFASWMCLTRAVA